VLNEQYSFLLVYENPLQAGSAKHKLPQLSSVATPMCLEPIRIVVTNPETASNRSIKQSAVFMGAVAFLLAEPVLEIVLTMAVVLAAPVVSSANAFGSVVVVVCTVKQRFSILLHAQPFFLHLFRALYKTKHASSDDGADAVVTAEIKPPVVSVVLKWPHTMLST
jgi:hypothetical protein